MPAVDGAIYFDEVAKAAEEGRITTVRPDKLLKTHAVWDLGWNDSMSAHHRAAIGIRAAGD